MPYDSIDALHEFAVVDAALRTSLVKMLRDAKKAEIDSSGLKAFANYVIDNKAAIVTFNYDDAVDEALYSARTWEMGRPGWHPDGGYGFYCRPSSICVADTPGYMDQPGSLVLKLHGSVNWRSRLGEPTVRGPAAILHHEEWVHEPPGVDPLALDRVESHLEPQPFIVPPVLVKQELALHPVLRVVWTLAQERLRAARQVVFVGYSLPVTDLASRILFGETLSNRSALQIQVVNLAQSPDQQRRLKCAYRSLFKDLADDAFDFAGAKDWITRHLTPPVERTMFQFES